MFRSRSPYRRYSPGRRTPPPEDAYRRGTSAPRYERKDRVGLSPNPKSSRKPPAEDLKSRSLPPSQLKEQSRQRREDKSQEDSKAKAEQEKEKAEKAFEERLKKLPIPEREKLLARRKKFGLPDLKDLGPLEKKDPEKRTEEGKKKALSERIQLNTKSYEKGT